MTAILHVRIDGHEVETTPAVLAQGVLDGKVDRDSPTTQPGRAGEQPLELALGTSHYEALTTELHRRLQLMCATDSSAVDVQELCARVERLCQWRWGNSPVTARLFWTAGWLCELADRPKSALDFYDAFLLLPAGEGHLRQLAMNNRGVLRIRAGRLEGVEDLARAAVGDCGLTPRSSLPPSAVGTPQTLGLPAACFNLLNFLNASFGSGDLLRTVDEELTAFFSRLPDDLRTAWLDAGDRADGSARIAEGKSPEVRGAPPLAPEPILRDPTHRRLNWLMVHLADRAREWAGDVYHPRERAASGFRRLSLWPTDNRPLECTEAATLLLGDEIPSSLARTDNPLAQLEQSAREEVAAVEGHLAAGQYELARSRLQVQRSILASLPASGTPNTKEGGWGSRNGLTSLLAHVDAQLERIAHHQRQHEQIEVQQLCAKFVVEVQEFCALTDAGQAHRMQEDLTRRLEQFRTQAMPRLNSETTALLEELATRARQHTQGLKRSQIEKSIEVARRCVQQNRPVDQTIAVPESVYEALAHCRRLDPEGWIEDWAALQTQLDAHQGQYHVQRALSAWRACPLSWERIEDDLVRALTYDPDTWREVAPWFGWGAEDCGWRIAEGGSGGPPSALRNPKLRLDRAGRLLERTLHEIGADASKCVRLWQGVETTLAVAVAGRDAKALAQAQRLAERCLNHWPIQLSEVPGRADPRNPVNRFLEACEKTRRVMEAEQLLGARPPRLAEAKSRLTGVLQAGLDRRDQFRRVVAGLYLAQFHEKDPPPVQRQVLARLEAWVETVPQDTLPQIQGGEIVKEMERVREGVKFDV